MTNASVGSAMVSGSERFLNRRVLPRWCLLILVELELSPSVLVSRCPCGSRKALLLVQQLVRGALSFASHPREDGEILSEGDLDDLRPLADGARVYHRAEPLAVEDARSLAGSSRCSFCLLARCF